MADIRPIEKPRRGSDGLFVEPPSYVAGFEVIERHRREIAFNHFKYADSWCGNPRTYDPEGRYNCGRCNQFNDPDQCLLVDVRRVDGDAGSCGDWENVFAGDPELLLHEKPVDASGYGVAANGIGFGCFRCPYAKAAGEPDSLGRDLWCGKFACRVPQTACCVLNGAPLKVGKNKPQDFRTALKYLGGVG